MVGNNNPYTTDNTRKQGETTVGEGMIGGWQVTPIAHPVLTLLTLTGLMLIMR